MFSSSFFLLFSFPPFLVFVDGHIKKGGAGGKYTWGKETDISNYDTATSTLDPRDPNYEDVLVNKDENHLESVKTKLNQLAKTHLDSHHQGLVSKLIKPMTENQLHTEFPQQVVNWSLQNHEREEKNHLLEFLHKVQESGLLSNEQVENAVHSIFDQASPTTKKGGMITKEEALALTVLGFERVIV